MPGRLPDRPVTPAQREYLHRFDQLLGAPTRSTQKAAREEMLHALAPVLSEAGVAPSGSARNSAIRTGR